jgi:hypothetical protein
MSQDFWAAVRLQPYREKLAISELRRSGFQLYCPRVLHVRRSRGRRFESTPLLFANYIFCFVQRRRYSAMYIALQFMIGRHGRR